MNFEELKKQAKDFLPAYLIDGLVNNTFFRITSFILYTGAVILGLISGGIKLANLFIDFSSEFTSRAGIIFGLFFIFLSVSLLFLALKSFFNSFAFLDIVPKIYDEDYKHSENMSFESAKYFLTNQNKDPLVGLLTSGISLFRLGISFTDLYGFIQNKIEKRKIADLDYSLLKDFISLEKIAGIVYDSDKEFQNFLTARTINKDEFVGAVNWMAEDLVMRRQYERFWSRDRLRMIPGIGKEWSYGETPTLWKYASRAEALPFFMEAQSIERSRQGEIDTLERVLLRMNGANALLVSETDSESLLVSMAMARRLAEGKVASEIEDKVVYVLDYNRLVSDTKEKNIFEKTLINALTESVTAGNIILVIRDLPGFMASVEPLGSNLSSLLDWYLKSPGINIVATASTDAYHSVLERDQAIMATFEKVNVRSAGSMSVLSYLKGEAFAIEAKEKIFFTFQAIKSAIESAERFFSEGNLEDKSLDLLSETAVLGKKQGKQIIEKQDILKLVEEKLGVPVSSTSNNPKSQENKVLLDLEKILAERVIGQDSGIEAISLAMRRAHSGIGNPNRPMGSFLFLGPTGVGKTETTKALADTFFGGESSIIRLDMSEFNTGDALERLIGDFARGKPGVLASKLRDKPYGVLLLDEFEKTSKEVHDLFLQVLDEGFFTDMSGKRVNARNLIIIATSNAGSSLIWNMVKESGEANLNKDKIISSIIDEGIFKPELINRFDGVVVFHPLNRENLKKIAVLMLKKLNRRLEGKGISVDINDGLVEALIQKGMDPTFGARPMARVIQDKVESLIAERLLRGEIKAGDKILFNETDLEKIRD